MKNNLLTSEELEELIEMAKSKNKYTAVSIILPHGRIDNETKRGYGYEHLVYERLFKDNLTSNEIAGLIIRTLELLKGATESQIRELEIGKKSITYASNMNIEKNKQNVNGGQEI